MCVCLCEGICVWVQMPKEARGMGCSWSWSYHGYECWELNSSPLQNPYALLTLSCLSSAMNYFMS